MPTETSITLERIWGLRVRDRRKLLGLTQRELAELVDPPTTQATVWRVEHGETAARDSLKRSLASALRCRPEELFPWDTQLGVEQ